MTSQISKAITLLLKQKETFAKLTTGQENYALPREHIEEHIWLVNAVALLLRLEEDRERSRWS